MRRTTLAGLKRQHDDKGTPSNWRDPPRPVPEMGGSWKPYNREHREIGGRREGVGGVHSSDEAEQRPWSQGTLLMAVALTTWEARVNDKNTHQFAGPEEEPIHQSED